MSDSIIKVNDPASTLGVGAQALGVTALAGMVGQMGIIDGFWAAVGASAIAGLMIFDKGAWTLKNCAYYPFVVATIFMTATGTREGSNVIIEPHEYSHSVNITAEAHGQEWDDPGYVPPAAQEIGPLGEGMVAEQEIPSAGYSVSDSEEEVEPQEKHIQEYRPVFRTWRN